MTPKPGFEGRRAVVTGAARGMGFAIAKRFAEQGGEVCLWDISQEALNEAVSRIAGSVRAMTVDVADPDAVQVAMDKAADDMNGLDTLVNSAGIAGPNTLVEAFPPSEWARVMQVNLNGTFHCCRAAVPYMRAAGSGRIVNIASVAGKEGNPNASAYSASKAGVIALTKSLGKELATTGITVNAITPAVIETEMLKDVTEAQIDYMLSKIPMGRMGTVDEIADMTLFLASDRCSYSTAAVFDMTGGRATY
ncbi:SDR family oxidoreductase [Sulfitobacter mediterraneus]|nr:SDR family NAD(P)-dependent oxidoreductase [Sulfitobacter mediterraneus]MBM1634379.1 SDR family oxidoreductase [Sulfitobacter mediterraneus]MBM1642196.1 SDR family oxidoreductase [Sulfitobacter mediterraneus]MBM1646245.1 SDR family oxidoreductase [Sulfitobacter mediterraneus]MBM1650291.1 SDR family oxidoreductase [Sulfitobacter mediterraneus]MBM1654313.1 SDR family oxidoreductase [Sulfitobacter mediterraneus]